ncbi:MAG TPA: pyridoxal-phosphate dependent enzyme [Planctomycetota bacterium]|nr:pyridoxal-phosphate dependent enzyme [Planctomycetota bacterium]
MDFTADPTLDWVNQFAAWALPLPLITPLTEEGSLRLKLETLQISGSAIYRAVHARLLHAVNDGQIHPGTILMGVGGNATGRALVEAGKRLGLKVELHASTAPSPFARRRLEGTGAQVIVHSSAKSTEHLLDQIRWRSRRYGHWFLDPGDPTSFHEAYESLGQELVIQLYRSMTVPRTFVCPVLDGTLIRVVGRRLKQAFPDLTTVGVILGSDPVPDPDVADLIERTEIDPRVMRRKGASLGAGGAACYRLAGQRDWRNAVLLIPG